MSPFLIAGIAGVLLLIALVGFSLAVISARADAQMQRWLEERER